MTDAPLLRLLLSHYFAVCHMAAGTPAPLLPATDVRAPLARFFDAMH